jgi:hypothetical protein
MRRLCGFLPTWRLRCDDLNAHDRRWIGDVAPRTRDDDPTGAFEVEDRFRDVDDEPAEGGARGAPRVTTETSAVTKLRSIIPPISPIARFANAAGPPVAHVAGPLAGSAASVRSGLGMLRGHHEPTDEDPGLRQMVPPSRTRR